MVLNLPVDRSGRNDVNHECFESSNCGPSSLKKESITVRNDFEISLIQFDRISSDERMKSFVAEKSK